MYFLVFINLVGYLLKIDINCIDMDRIILVYIRSLFIFVVLKWVFENFYIVCVYLL